ncbi:hypothetical protein [Laspinema olomoucense]|uniref:hypothetical protein n=1 Tax=Laspinema olomoucense TaxID=3231600 RepID=UPI0021BB9257|nr:hypothetical protein [Laspinema sp. D3c]MCT7996182.1 hypothetical protein [Laspinema sp. D3c]
MVNLSTGELLYLLYAFAYTEEEQKSVTQGTVKRYLPKSYRTEAGTICESLLEQKFLDSPKLRRVTVSLSGKEALVTNLQTTDYEFTTVKGSRVVNALMACLKLTASFGKMGEISQEKDLGFQEFVEKFKKFYFEERKRQSLAGTYVMREKEILQKFSQEYNISGDLLQRYYKRLQEEGLISVVQGREDKNLQWVE